MNKEEIWKPIIGFKGYEVSTLGRVRSHLRNNITYIEGTVHRGYKRIALSVNGVEHKKLLHIILLETFVGPCPPNHVTRHLDGNRLNNNLNNITWGTYSENTRDRIKHGRMSHVKLNTTNIRHIKLLVMCGSTNLELAELFGVDRTRISNIRHETPWTRYHIPDILHVEKIPKRVDFFRYAT